METSSNQHFSIARTSKLRVIGALFVPFLWIIFAEWQIYGTGLHFYHVKDLSESGIVRPFRLIIGLIGVLGWIIIISIPALYIVLNDFVILTLNNGIIYKYGRPLVDVADVSEVVSSTKIYPERITFRCKNGRSVKILAPFLKDDDEIICQNILKYEQHHIQPRTTR
jgi:hypothetical protein